MSEKIKKARTMLMFLCILTLSLCSRRALGSEQAGKMPQPEERSCSLTIDCIYSDQNKQTEIDGVELEIFQVAELTSPDGAIVYQLLPEYEDPEMNIQTMTAAQSGAYAKKLLAKAEEGALPGVKKTSDQKGRIYYDQLKQGIYLVAQTGATGSAKAFEAYSPFLLLVPGISDDNTWIYDLVTNPKPVLKKDGDSDEGKDDQDSGKDRDNKNKTPKTGDETNVDIWMILFVIALCGVLFTLTYLFITGKHKANK